jgi:tRNA A37 methylthiotransferase MiaB
MSINLNIVHIRCYGCQMNVNDTQITSTILQNSGYDIVSDINDVNIVKNNNLSNSLFEPKVYLN